VARVVYRRVVARAAAVVGGVEQLALLLDVSSSLVTRWIEGRAPVPVEIFLKCVDHLQNYYRANLGVVPPQPPKLL
jgi:hypothetical protein